MNGFQHLPSQQDQRFWVYTGNKVANGYQTWSKPPGISFISIITIGGGGGGSGAAIWQDGVQVRGGGGGGAAAMTPIFLPAYLVPDILYINVGLGGAGGAASTTTTANAGLNGGATYVGYYPVQSAGYTLCVANGGNGGTAAGIGGSAPSVVTSTSMPLSQIGLRNYQTNGGGSSGGVPTANSITGGWRHTGGSGGGGKAAASTFGLGGSVQAAGEYGVRVIAAPAAGTDGAKVEDLVKFISAGGAGPNSQNIISGSNGGWGGFGSGGGGGAVGAGRGGAGGNGGDGLVIITCG